MPKFFLLIILLFPFSILSFGNWIKYFSDKHDNTFYYKNVQKNGDKITFYSIKIAFYSIQIAFYIVK